MIQLQNDIKTHIWNCLIFNYIACLLAVNSYNSQQKKQVYSSSDTRKLFLSLIDLVDDKNYKQNVSFLCELQKDNNLNITKEMQTIQRKVAKLYPNTPSITINQRVNAILRKCARENITPRNPKIWGPTMWALLHWLSLMYTKKNSKKIESVVHLIIENLPCSICVNHATKYLKTNQIPINSGNKAVYQYFFSFHNAVNKQTNKKMQPEKNMLQKIKQTCMETIQYL